MVKSLSLIDCVADSKQPLVFDLIQRFFVSHNIWSDEESDGESDPISTASHLASLTDADEDWRSVAKRTLMSNWSSFTAQLTHCVTGTDSDASLTEVGYLVADMTAKLVRDPYFSKLSVSLMAPRASALALQRNLEDLQDSLEAIEDAKRPLTISLLGKPAASMLAYKALTDVIDSRRSVRRSLIHCLRFTDDLFKDTLRNLRNL
jgi:hypothetical protein